jgi:hypothetical protein
MTVWGPSKEYHIPSTKLGEVKDISYVVVLQRLSNEELEKVKETVLIHRDRSLELRI